jgi:TonB family protein
MHLGLVGCLSLLHKQPTSLPKVVMIELVPAPVRVPHQEPHSRKVVQTKEIAPSQKPAPDAQLGRITQVVDRQTVGQQTKMGHSAAPKSIKLKDLGVGQAKPQPLAAAGDGAPEDHLDGYKSGAETMLNTVEYKYYGFFQRIRERLDLAWTKTLRERLLKFYRSGRQLAGGMDHETLVQVTMNGQGEIIKVDVIGDSGTQTLDDAAVQAFNDAGPFPNPPRGLVTESGGVIQIQWAFILRT